MSERICAVDGCGRAPIARGWCRKHYSRWWRHGDPLYVTPWSPPPQNRPRIIGCSVEGCDLLHHAKGFCHSHYSQAWYRANTEASKAYQAAYRAPRRAIAQRRSAEWRAANPERVLAGNRRWYAEHADQVREYRRRYRVANRDKIRALNNRRKATQRGVEVNDLTAEQWTDIKAAFDQRCAYCGKRRRLTMDHVVPLAKGGHHTAANIVPACQPCNSRKNAGPAPPYQPLLL